MANVLVVGGGFRGIIASHFLNRAGHAVTLSERAPFLGGVMRSEPWDGFFLDKGCHLFSNDTSEITDVMLAILGDNVVPVEFSYASVLNGRKTDGFAIPDLSNLDHPTRSRILCELVLAAAEPARDGQPPETLDAALCDRFGPTAAACLNGPVRKMFREDATALDPSAMGNLNFGRLKLLPETASAMLKQCPQLDARLAASSQHDPLRFVREHIAHQKFRNFYPAQKGMTGFCEAAERHLADIGVVLRLGRHVARLAETAEATSCTFDDGSTQLFDRVIWTIDMGLLATLLDGENPLQSLVHSVPMVLYYFVLPDRDVGPYSYMQNFDLDHILFRASAAGRYGRQIRDDATTYICCEATTEMDSALWREPERYAQQVWDEAVWAGVVSGRSPIATKILQTPVSYRTGRPGYTAAQRDLATRLAASTDRIFVAEQNAFARREIFQDLARIAA